MNYMATKRRWLRKKQKCRQSFSSAAYYGAPNDKRALIAVSLVLLRFFLLHFTSTSPISAVAESRLIPAPPLLELAFVSTSTKFGMEGRWMKGTILL